jgi:hypothetical protein
MDKYIKNLMIALLMLSNSVMANDIGQPTEKVILTVFGNVENTNSEIGAQFDRGMLLGLKQTEIVTKTPWTNGASLFEGPSIKDLLKLVGGNGETIVATALNGYQITIPMNDVNEHTVSLALKRNNKVLSVRQKGPIWVIYPWSDKEELRSNVYYSRSIWQLKSLEIR